MYFKFFPKQGIRNPKFRNALGWVHCRLVFMLGYRRCDEGHLSVTQAPLLHGMSPWLISEVVAVANVRNTLDFSFGSGTPSPSFP